LSEPLRITPAQAAEQMRSGATYVDVRSEPEFAEGHPLGAINVPLAHMGPAGMVPNPDFLRVMLAVFPRDARLVIGCKSGGRSLRAARELLLAGFKNVVDQRAGWSGEQDAFGRVTLPGWARVGLPSETGEPEGRSYADQCARAARS
jgi:rhodanese-related sulfurtransferase